jgi:hypothetical protein
MMHVFTSELVLDAGELLENVSVSIRWGFWN